MKIKTSCLFLFFTLPLFSQQKGATPLNHPAIQPSNHSTFAVVVGISDYQDPGIPDLRFADRDAEAFANFLRSPAGGSLDGDHLQLLTNEQATGAQIFTALDWLIDEVQEGDRVIIYFSGHGDVESKRISQPGYLLGWDAPARVYAAGGTMNIRDFQDYVSTLSVNNKGKVLVVTDACHSGKLSGSDINGAQLTSQNLARQYANEIKILSCQPNEYSIEGEQWGGGRGAFSFNLVDALYGFADGDNDLFVTLKEVSRYLEDHVSAEVAPVSQNPKVVGYPTERLAVVDAKLLADLRSGRTSQMAMLSSIDSRGIEDDVLASVDTTTRELYRLFKKAIKDKVFLDPTDACADAYYQQLLAEPKMKRLHATMTRNYAAALQDDAQQAINIWLKADVQQLECIGKSLRLEPIPRLLGRAAELLGEGHYMYRSLQARKLLFEGILMMKHDNPDEALGHDCLSVFRKSLELEPTSPLPLRWMSEVYVKNLRQPDSALVCVEQASILAPNWVLPFADLGYTLINLDEFELSKQALLAAEKIDSLHPYVLNRWAMWYVNQGGAENAEKAITLFEQYRKNGGAMYPCWHNDYALALKLFKEYEAAENELHKAIELDSNSSTIWTNLGTIYLLANRYDESEIAYQKGVALDSTRTVAWNQLGTLYFYTKQYAKAEPIFKKVIAFDSTDAMAWNNLGAVYNMTKRYVEAEPFLKKAIVLDSTLELAWSNLGYLYKNTSNYEEAKTVYSKMVSIDSMDASAWEDLGFLYVNTHQYAEAEIAIKKAISLDSALVLAWEDLGNLYLQTMRYPEAISALNKAIELNPKRAKPRKYLGMVFFKINRPIEARQNFLKAIELNPNYNRAKLGMAYLLSSEGKTEEALDYVEQAIEKGSTFEQLQQDEDLAPLRALPSWKDLMRKYFPDQYKD
ncbi:MAG: tetratricopeptide repeat protein [Saprospiraceae bacterium]